MYKEIPLNKIDPNPWQTRENYDKDTRIGLMTSSVKHGILQAPLVRPHPTKKGVYQVVFGHSRIDSQRDLEKETMVCNVRDVDDSAMKKLLLIENVLRSDLAEKEKFEGIEQYRLDPDTDDPRIKQKLLNKEYGWVMELSRQTGVPQSTLGFLYDVREMREKLKVTSRGKLNVEEISHHIIAYTQGLEEADRLKLVVKANNMGWGQRTVLSVKTTLKSMDEKIRALLLDENRRLPKDVVIAIGKIGDTPWGSKEELQLKVIEQIGMHKLNLELALNLVERVKEGPLETEIKVADEVEEILEKMSYVHETAMGWGVNEYMILSNANRWAEACELFTKIENKMVNLKVKRFE